MNEKNVQKNLVQLKAMRNVRIAGMGGDIDGVDEATSPEDVEFFSLYIGYPGAFVHMRDFSAGQYEADDAERVAKQVAHALEMETDFRQLHDVCNQEVWTPAQGKFRTASAVAAKKISDLLLERRTPFEVTCTPEGVFTIGVPEKEFTVIRQSVRGARA